MGSHHLERVEALGGAGKAYLLTDYSVPQPTTGDQSKIRSAATSTSYRATVDRARRGDPTRRGSAGHRARRELTPPRAPTRLVLIGHPVSHSLSPRFQNAALRAAGIPLTYERETSRPAICRPCSAGWPRQGAAGNITVPHKERPSRRCARLTPIARRVGRRQHVLGRDGALVGDNTDVGGFHNAVVHLRGGRTPAQATIARTRRRRRRGRSARGGRRLADGASLASGIARRSGRAALCARFPGVAIPVPTLAASAIAGAALVVHATTIGVTGDDVPIDPGLLPPTADVMDLVYRRGETTWVRAGTGTHGHPGGAMACRC